VYVALAAENVTLKMEEVLDYGLNLRIGPSRKNNCNNNNNYHHHISIRFYKFSPSSGNQTPFLIIIITRMMMKIIIIMIMPVTGMKAWGGLGVEVHLTHS
jgi:hypothetical protein